MLKVTCRVCFPDRLPRTVHPVFPFPFLPFREPGSGGAKSRFHAQSEGFCPIPTSFSFSLFSSALVWLKGHMRP